MNISALISAIGGALLGALIWGAIAYFTGYEVGYIAWGIGALIGGLAHYMGSSGQAAGILCAVLALLSIFGGKCLAVKWSFMERFQGEIRAQLKEDVYREDLADARDFAALSSEEQYPQFMISHKFTDAKKPAEVSARELANFKESHVERLKWVHASQPSFEQWRERVSRGIAEQNKDLQEDLPVVELVKEDLGTMDILFALLGVATAFQIARGSSRTAPGQDEAQAQ